MNEQVLDNFVNWLKQNRPGLEESSYRQYRSGVSSACRIWQQQPQDITEMTGAELARIFSAVEKEGYVIQPYSLDEAGALGKTMLEKRLPIAWGYVRNGKELQKVALFFVDKLADFALLKNGFYR